MAHRYDNTTEEWRYYSHILPLMVRAKPGRAYLLDFVKRHRPQPLALDALPAVGDRITHVYTGNIYTVIGQDSVVRSGVREIRYKLDDNSFLGATAFLKGYRLAVADDFKQAATPEVERRAAATAEDDGYIITGSDTFCSAASGVGEKLLKELEAKSRVNPTHNPDAPQTQEEIDAAWQRHKDFFGR